MSLEQESEGPSPLTRGNPQSLNLVGRLIGPIPAHAGQPLGQSATNTARRAHPRSRGATHGAHRHRVVMGGPSPLTRGNP